jgi:hypothetical protein
LADPEEFRASAAAYRQARFRIEVVALATPEALSQLGILDRFLTGAAEGGGRYVSWENHDACAKGMLRTLAVIEAEQLADRVTVVRRDGTVLYNNELVDGIWRRRMAADTAVAAERGRPWTARETASFRRELARADQRLHRELLCEDRRLAVQRDSERAAALAEPVRRVAQPRPEPPGVDYHRLSAEEHRWTHRRSSTAPACRPAPCRRPRPPADNPTLYAHSPVRCADVAASALATASPNAGAILNPRPDSPVSRWILPSAGCAPVTKDLSSV